MMIDLPPASIVVNILHPVEVSFDINTFVSRILEVLDLKCGVFEFSFVDNATIIEVNRQFLGRDYATDIISFNLGDAPDIIGDVYISIEQATINALEFGQSLDDELKLLLVHGVLHLLGYEDYTDEDRSLMDAEQHRILQEILTRS